MSKLENQIDNHELVVSNIMYNIKYNCKLDAFINQLKLSTPDVYTKNFTLTIHDKKYILEDEKQPLMDAFLEKNIYDFDELSVRALNGLKSMNICNIKELLKYSEGTLMKIRHMGKRTTSELKGFLEKYDLKLPEKDL